MTSMHETVSLPDPARQPLLHPLDLPAARRLFFVAWFVSVVGHPLAAISLGIILWTISNNPVTPVIATASLVLGSRLAGRYLLAEAWAFIPRKRQARDRRPPIGWEGTGALLQAALLAGAILLSLRWLEQHAAPAGVLPFIAGGGIGVSLLVASAFAWRVLRGWRGSGDDRGVLLQLPSGVVVIAATVYATGLARAEQVASDWTVAGLVAGAATLIVAQLLHWTYQAVQSRRNRDHGPAAGPDAGIAVPS